MKTTDQKMTDMVLAMDARIKELEAQLQATAAPEPEYHPSGATWKEAYEYANNEGLHWDGTGWRKATAAPESERVGMSMCQTLMQFLTGWTWMGPPQRLSLIAL